MQFEWGKFSFLFTFHDLPVGKSFAPPNGDWQVGELVSLRQSRDIFLLLFGFGSHTTTTQDSRKRGEMYMIN